MLATKTLANMHNPAIAFQPGIYGDSENKGTMQQKSAMAINAN